MITVETIKTQDGYYGRVVAEGHMILHRTPTYLTQYMAMASASCWEAFNMTDICTCPLDLSRIVEFCGDNCKHIRSHGVGRSQTDKAVAAAEAVCPDLKASEYVIEAGDTVRTVKSRNGVPTATWTGEEFAEKLTLWMNKWPELQFKVGQVDDNGRQTQGGDFFLSMRITGRDRPRWFIVKKK